MELVYTCKGCQRDRVLESESKTREELMNEAEGTDFNVICPFCKVKQKINVNYVTALKTTFEKWAPLIYWKISLFILLIFFQNAFAFVAFFISFLIPIFIYNKLESDIKAFNSIRVHDNFSTNT